MAKKQKKLPKQPKASASLTVWENWKRRVSEVKKYNADLKRDEAKKKSIIKQARAIKK